MLLALAYHRIGRGKYTNSFEMFRAHLSYLKEKYPLVLPGDPLPRNKLTLCLTFDDATFDFYHFIFPLLKEWEIRVLLGVPVHYILEDTKMPPEKRLEVPYGVMMQEGIFDTQAPFCTWKELQEMVSSGYVEVASHTYLHPNLTYDFVNLDRELKHSKEVLEGRLGQAVTSLIYPFGRVSPRVQQEAAKEYRYTFRLGSCLNRNWGSGRAALCRVVGDQMVSATALTSPWALTKYFAKYLIN